MKIAPRFYMKDAYVGAPEKSRCGSENRGAPEKYLSTAFENSRPVGNGWSTRWGVWMWKIGKRRSGSASSTSKSSVRASQKISRCHATYFGDQLFIAVLILSQSSRRSVGIAKHNRSHTLHLNEISRQGGRYLRPRISPPSGNARLQNDVFTGQIMDQKSDWYDPIGKYRPRTAGVGPDAPWTLLWPVFKLAVGAGPIHGSPFGSRLITLWATRSRRSSRTRRRNENSCVSMMFSERVVISNTKRLAKEEFYLAHAIWNDGCRRVVGIGQFPNQSFPLVGDVARRTR